MHAGHTLRPVVHTLPPPCLPQPRALDRPAVMRPERTSAWRLAPIAAIAMLAVVATAPWHGAATQGCSKRDFEQVVDDAAAALRDLNAKNRPAFQDKLRVLKDKRGWSTDQFLLEATTFVQDDKIGEYDQTSAELLSRINSMGAEGSAAAQPDCALLGEVNGAMKQLVDAQRAKWSYMFSKLDAALKN